MPPLLPSAAVRRADTPRDGIAGALSAFAVAAVALAPAALLPAPAPAGPSAAPSTPMLTAPPPAVMADRRASAPQRQEHQADAPFVRRERAGLVIAAQSAPRAEVARQLAAATGEDPRAAAAALASARALTLHWQGRDAAEAWRLVLGDQASHALQCSAGRCRLWWAAALPPADAVEAVPSRAWGEASGGAGARVAAPVETPDEVPDEVPVSEPPMPDPPGLFPRE